MKLTKDFKFLDRTFGERPHGFKGRVYQSEDKIVSTEKLSIWEDVFTGKVYTIEPMFGEGSYVVLDEGDTKVLTAEGFKTLKEIRETLPNIMTYFVDTTPYGKRFLRMGEKGIASVTYRSVKDLPCSSLDAKSFIVDSLKIAKDGE